MPLRVDAATGATTLFEADLRVPGYIPLVLARAYRSDRETQGPLGAGWQFNLDVTLEVGRDQMVFRGALGRDVAFAPIQTGVQATHHETGLVVQHHPKAFVVFFSPLLQHVFPKQAASGKVLHLGRIEDRSGNAIQFGYSGSRLVRLVDTVGRQVHFTYNGDRITAVHVASGEGTVAVRAFRYDGAGDLVAVRDAAGREQRYAYQRHLMVSYTNRLGGTYYAQYDEERRCTALWCRGGSVVRRFAYDAARQATLVQATDGLQTVYRHDGARVFSRIGPSGEAQHYYYDEQQRLQGFTDEAGDLVVAQRRDPEEQTLALITGKEHTIMSRLNDRGQAQQVRVGSFGPFGLDYNEQGHLVELSVPSGGQWVFDRDGQGTVTQITSPEGRRVRLTRSQKGRELTVSDELGTRFTERYDGMGRLIERADAQGRRQRRQYDEEGRLAAVALESGYQIRFAYDPAGHLVGLSDSEGVKATLKRDPFGRLLSHNGAGASWDFQYDRDGRLLTATGKGLTLRLEYEMGRLTGLTTPTGKRRWPVEPGSSEATEPLVGLAGELRRVGDEDDATVFSYDADGRLTRVEHGAGSLTLDYDGDGWMRAMRQADTEITLRRDRRGRVTEAVDSDQVICRFEYDASDRLTALQPSSGASLAFRYDALDRLVECREGSAAHRLSPGDVRSHALREAMPDGASPWAVLFAGRQGLILAVPFEGLHVPIWFQDDVWHRGATSWLTRIAEVALRGAETVLRERAAPDAFQALRAWQRDEGFRWLYTEVPGALDLAGLSLPVDGFFLQRVYHDFFYPGWTPFTMLHHRNEWSRTPDDAVTGSHMASPLKPAPPALSRRGTVRGHPPQPEDVPHLLAHRT